MIQEKQIDYAAVEKAAEDAWDRFHQDVKKSRDWIGILAALAAFINTIAPLLPIIFNKPK